MHKMGIAGDCQMRARAMLLLLVVTAAGPTSCSGPRTPPVPEPVFEEVPIRVVTDVDLLFVVDDSESMLQEQAVLREQFAILARELIDPVNPTASAVESLHVGVVSTDMGTAGVTIQTCSNPDVGDDGELHSTSPGGDEGCEAIYNAPDCERDECPWLVHSIEHPAADPAHAPIWEDFGCIAALGSGGCGFEQPLESSYRALVEQTQPGGYNEGFLRDDSLLAIVFVTDEDDCSTDEPGFFDPARDDLEPLQWRCVIDADLLFPVSRYHDALVTLHGERVVVAAIAGVPIDGSWSPGDPLEELRELQVQPDPQNPDMLRRSCDTTMGVDFPPVRLAELVSSFGDDGVLGSVCRPDWTDTLQQIARTMQQHVGRGCVDLRAGVAPVTDCRLIQATGDGREVPHASVDPQGWSVDMTGEECPGGQLRIAGEPARQDSFVFECRSE
jgi:hypothetical protein